jgi:acid phosphatase (class A)
VERLPEILAQYTTHHEYYLGLLMVRRETHPATYLLLKIAARVTELTMVYFKYKYNRPRPYQYYPALMPPLDTSVHPSYPNGHALFGLMKAYCVADVVPQMREPMLQLAQRIWHNAEIGGFHFPSDALASGKIAEGAMELLRGVLNYQGCPSYKRAVEAAKLEWQGIIRTI